MALIVSLIFALLTLVAITLQKTYKHVPLKELKRRARMGDPIAGALYRAATYGISLDILLWLIIGLSTAAFAVSLARGYSAWLAFFGVVALMWFGFGWMSKSRPSSLSLSLARWLAPLISWLLNKLHPLFNWVVEFVHQHRPITVHTGVFEKEDLLDLISEQKVAAHNRIDEMELDIAAHALTFGDKLIREVMTPRKVAHFVKVSDSIGPVLLNELHKSGFSRFPVVGENNDEIVGTLYLHDLVDKNVNGHVKDIMSKRVYYVQEELSLWHALNAFLKTKHHLFIVVNNFEEVVGVISIEDVLEQILGREIVDEFDRYDDLRSVAQLVAERERLSKEEKMVE